MTDHLTNPAVDQFARRIAARLDEANRDLPHDITERLRSARAFRRG